MRIYVEVHYKVKAGKREEFYKKIVEQGIDIASREEPGNEKYDYYYEIEDADSICLLEVWKSRDDQKLHGQTEHYARLTELKNEYVLDASVTIYDLCE